MDTVAIYDTQQAGPVCLLTKPHYTELTDLTWSSDEQCLMLSSRDGYCTLHSVPILYASSSHGHTSGSGSQAGGSRKRPLGLLTPAASLDRDRKRDVVILADSMNAARLSMCANTTVPFACRSTHRYSLSTSTEIKLCGLGSI
ncbi:hypothetical protein B0H16DRAFT_1903334 [Mycena metata]|uniref:Uncharacterized protein n=1 Tax=Mycena metata TaxID=1033252 RepID=A0AAD7DSM5_9AGAR|nr:hypothetical protein B0H16DRAFT_1903334 [Mycena metata]